MCNNDLNSTSKSDKDSSQCETPSSETQTTPTLQKTQNNKELDILIIEDDAIAHRVLSLQLNTLCHCNITSAYNLESAMTHLDKTYHIIFADFHFPDGTVLPFAKQYLSLHPSIPIVTITAYTSAQDHEQLLKQGVVGVYIKPIRIELLKQLLETYVC